MKKEDKKIIYEFFLRLPYDFRRIMRKVFDAHPESLDAFLKILRKKQEFRKNPTLVLSEEVLNLEKEEIKKLYV